MVDNSKIKLTNKKLFKKVGICFAIFIICLFIPPKEEIDTIIAAVGLVSFLGGIGILVFIIIRVIKDVTFPNKHSNKVINSETKIIENITNKSTINDTNAAKLPKSSQKRILKAKIKKAIKADSNKEKKNNPVKSISYIPPSEDELKNRERDQYLKRNFESKLKILWKGSINIEFSYSDAKNDITYRFIELNKVTINDNGNIYFLGICDNHGEERTFKTERIISDIEYNHHNYTLKQFLSKVLNIGDKSRVSKEKIKKETFDIHFTGFRKADEERLVKLAQSKDLMVRKSITQNLQVLCIGYNASKNKIQKAQGMGISIMNESDFLNFLETGEILLGE